MSARLMALTLLAISSAANAAPAPRPPTGKWVVNFADAQCVATRDYGTAEEPFYLVLKQPAIGGVLQIGVVRKGSKADATQFDGEILIDDRATIPTSLLEFGNKKLGQRAIIANLPSAQLTLMRQARSIRIRARDDGVSKIGTRLATNMVRTDESFALSSMPALLSTLDSCAADLRKVWKVWEDDKGSVGAGLREGPAANLQRLFDADDYPGISILRDQGGVVAVVLLIDEQGKVADCTVTETSGVAALDAQSCAIIKERGKFKPAIGVDGQPAKSAWIQRITWRLVG